MSTYVDEQNTKIGNLEEQTKKIKDEISASTLEIAKSKATSAKISGLLDLDLDEDGIPDVDQLPPDENDTPTPTE